MQHTIGDTLHQFPDLGTEWRRVGGTGHFIIWHVLISTFGGDVSGTFTVEPSPSPPCVSCMLQRVCTRLHAVLEVLQPYGGAS